MNITPLIDIVFLLIIFFITVTQITQVNETALQLARLRGEEEQGQATVTINIDQNEEIFISGVNRSVADAILIVGKEKNRVGSPDLVRVRIRHDDRSRSSETLNKLIRALVDQGINQVQLPVEQNE